MNSGRVRIIRQGLRSRSGPVVYWMSRDQRSEDNWALLHAQKMALEYRRPLLVVFCLAPSFLGATRRQYGFMLRGLTETFTALEGKNIPATLLLGYPSISLPEWLTERQASLLVIDFDPLRIKRQWQGEILDALDISCHEVDAHNIVPCWLASPKQEYAAYTFRPKISRLLKDFLTPLPVLAMHPYDSSYVPPAFPKVDGLLSALKIDQVVGETELAPGGNAAGLQLAKFIRTNLDEYERKSNDPTCDVQSQLSPYLHFGLLSAQRVALTVEQAGRTPSASVFLEELIVRRELADNYCYYQPNYDRCEAFAPWAQKTLAEHVDDERDSVYRPSEFEQGRTHDELWNSAQNQMVRTGKMHGYIRMYWAKKILEWSKNPDQAMKTAIYLNDKYSLDGRDSNGYTGIAWSIGGVHDRAWSERRIFGKIRYMSHGGMKRKFSVAEYIDRYR